MTSVHIFILGDDREDSQVKRGSVDQNFVKLHDKDWKIANMDTIYGFGGGARLFIGNGAQRKMAFIHLLVAPMNMMVKEMAQTALSMRHQTLITNL